MQTQNNYELLDILIQELSLSIQEFENTTNAQEKGEALNKSQNKLAALQSMISGDTLLSRRKKINDLKSRLAKGEKVFIQEYDKQLLYDNAKKLKEGLDLLKRKGSKKDEILQNYEKTIRVLEKLIEQYRDQTSDEKLKKLVKDAINIYDEFIIRVTEDEEEKGNSRKTSYSQSFLYQHPLKKSYSGSIEIPEGRSYNTMDNKKGVFASLRHAFSSIFSPCTTSSYDNDPVIIKQDFQNQQE